MNRIARTVVILGLAAGGLAACAPGDQPTVIVEGGACSNNDYGPALDNYVASMDDNDDGVINSDEFNTAFQEADDDDDGRLDTLEMKQAICGN
ncbi:MAG: hypothetical protein U1E14_00665 [Geminicoccaceae bacterium]